LTRRRTIKLRRFVLLCAAGLSVVLAALVILFLRVNGHAFYVVDGMARITPSAVEQTSLPAVVCVGRGGPLETSAVVALPQGFENEPQTGYLFCRTPSAPITIDYQISLYTSMKPRRMHAYVWLELHRELASYCSPGGPLAVKVPTQAFAGYRSEAPPDWPCFKPATSAALGYAVAFDDWGSARHEARNIEVVPDGYRVGRAGATGN
jgi:hypothetical protein